MILIAAEEQENFPVDGIPSSGKFFKWAKKLSGTNPPSTYGLRQIRWVQSPPEAQIR